MILFKLRNKFISKQTHLRDYFNSSGGVFILRKELDRASKNNNINKMKELFK